MPDHRKSWLRNSREINSVPGLDDSFEELFPTLELELQGLLNGSGSLDGDDVSGSSEFAFEEALIRHAGRLPVVRPSLRSEFLRELERQELQSIRRRRQMLSGLVAALLLMAVYLHRPGSANSMSTLATVIPPVPEHRRTESGESSLLPMVAAASDGDAWALIDAINEKRENFRRAVPLAFRMQ